MSMWLNLAKISSDQLELIRREPQRFDGVFFDDDVDGIEGLDESVDVFGTDYRTLSAIAEALEIDIDDGASWLSRATGNGIGSEAAYEFCYGPGFLLTVDEVKQVAEGLAAEPWAADALAIDDDENMPGLLRFFALAMQEGKAVIGGVS